MIKERRGGKNKNVRRDVMAALQVSNRRINPTDRNQEDVHCLHLGLKSLARKQMAAIMS